MCFLQGEQAVGPGKGRLARCSSGLPSAGGREPGRHRRGDAQAPGAVAAEPARLPHGGPSRRQPYSTPLPPAERGELVVSGLGSLLLLSVEALVSEAPPRGLSVFPESWFCCNECSFRYGLDGWLCSRTARWALCRCFLVFGFGGSLALATFKFLRFCC